MAVGHLCVCHSHHIINIIGWTKAGSYLLARYVILPRRVAVM